MSKTMRQIRLMGFARKGLRFNCVRFKVSGIRFRVYQGLNQTL